MLARAVAGRSRGRVGCTRGVVLALTALPCGQFSRVVVGPFSIRTRGATIKSKPEIAPPNSRGCVRPFLCYNRRGNGFAWSGNCAERPHFAVRLPSEIDAPQPWTVRPSEAGVFRRLTLSDASRSQVGSRSRSHLGCCRAPRRGPSAAGQRCPAR